MLSVAYDPALVLGAVLVALMAAYTGLHLTHGLTVLPASERKPQIVKAAITLGGGVWSTHFVAMLALDLPVAIFYDPVPTLASALIAILFAGAGLLVMHFGDRGTGRTALAGACLGAGVVMMHYVGMRGIRGCGVTFGATGYALATVLAIAMGIGALRLAYAPRSRRGLLLGACVFAAAILAMHFTAMRWTGFFEIGPMAPGSALVSNEILALFVVVSAFLICGAFLLTTVTLPDAGPAAPAPVSTPPQPPSTLRRVPFEQDGRTYFSAPEEIVAIQAEGHYTRLHRIADQVFCPLAIAKLEAALDPQQFLRTHRSYLVNLRHVRGFERRKDQGVCLFDPTTNVAPVPVSRANVPPTMKALGL